jgi:hypothetical protein
LNKKESFCGAASNYLPQLGLVFYLICSRTYCQSLFFEFSLPSILSDADIGTVAYPSLGLESVGLREDERRIIRVQWSIDFVIQTSVWHCFITYWDQIGAERRSTFAHAPITAKVAGHCAENNYITCWLHHLLVTHLRPDSAWRHRSVGVSFDFRFVSQCSYLSKNELLLNFRNSNQ